MDVKTCQREDRPVDKKKKKKLDEDTVSDYEKLLNGFAADADAGTGGGTDDGLVLSELLDGASGQGRSGGTFNIGDLSDIDFSDLTIEDKSADSGAAGTKKTNSGKFEIQLDDNLSDYASILNELEKSGDGASGKDSAEDSDDASTLDFDLDLSTLDMYPEPSADLQEKQSAAGEKEESLEDILNSLEPDALDQMPLNKPGMVVDITPAKTADLSIDLASLTGGEPAGQGEPFDSIGTGGISTGEFASIEADTYKTADFKPEVSYTGFISDEDNLPEEESVLDFAPEETNALTAAEDGTATGAETVSDETAPSYADLLGADLGGMTDVEEIAHDDAVLDLTDGHEHGVSLENEPLAFGKDELSLDASDFNLEADDHAFAFDSEELAAGPETDEIALTPDEDSIVVSSGDSHDEISEEIDFLAVDESVAAKSDDSFLGVADVREAKLPEIMLEGIEMNAADQMNSVTRAELLMAQGRRDLARDIYERIARERGVSPFVAKRLQQLRVGRSETTAEAEELANQ
jgi:hypothetical protein